MKKFIKKIFSSMQNEYKKIKRVFTNPGDAFAKFLYWNIYKGDNNKIPYPIFLPVIRKNSGGWSGMGIYLNMRERQYNLKVNKLKKIIPIGIIIIVIIFLCIGATQRTDNFFYGIAQNLFSDVILILLIIYILPKYLNAPKKYKVALIVEHAYDVDSKFTNEILIQNMGQEVYKSKEIYWEIFGGTELKKEDICLQNGNFENYDKIPMIINWRMYGHNETPLFLDQKEPIAKIKMKEGNSINLPVNNKVKIYYRLYTINGNLPLEWEVTSDFNGLGVEPSMYPKFGEISLS